MANRVFPTEGADDWRAGWVMAQDEVLDPGRRSPSRACPSGARSTAPAEPVGVAALTELASRGVRRATTRWRRRRGDGPFRITRNPRGAVLRLALPLVSRTEVDLARNGDELVVTVGSYRRLLTLPHGLTRYRVAGARVEQGQLQVRFEEKTS